MQRLAIAALLREQLCAPESHMQRSGLSLFRVISLSAAGMCCLEPCTRLQCFAHMQDFALSYMAVLRDSPNPSTAELNLQPQQSAGQSVGRTQTQSDADLRPPLAVLGGSSETFGVRFEIARERSGIHQILAWLAASGRACNF